MSLWYVHVYRLKCLTMALADVMCSENIMKNVSVSRPRTVLCCIPLHVPPSDLVFTFSYAIFGFVPVPNVFIGPRLVLSVSL